MWYPCILWHQLFYQCMVLCAMIQYSYHCSIHHNFLAFFFVDEEIYKLGRHQLYTRCCSWLRASRSAGLFHTPAMLDIQFVFSLFHQIKMMYLYSQLTCICILLQLHIYREIPSEGAIIGQNGYSFKPPSCKSG